VSLPAVPGCRSEGRSITEARRNIREALATCADVFDDADQVARDAEILEEIRLPRGARKLIDQAHREREAAARQATRAREVTSDAARRLTSEVGLSLRDAGELLGLSHQRVKQLASK
jgi:hypothetical protein